MRIGYSVDGDLGVMELDNPPDNALDSPAFEDEAKLKDFLSRAEIKGVVVRGEGRNFSTGADVDELARRRRGELGAFEEELAAGKRLLDAIRYSEVPVVAAIRGACFGGGLEIALACHFRVASENALLGFPEADHGLMPGLGGTWLAGAGLRRGTAVELVLTGRLLRGDEAAQLGLVDVSVKTAEVFDRARALLEGIVAQRTPAQIRSVMRAIHNAERLDRDTALAEETRLFLALAAGAAP